MKQPNKTDLYLFYTFFTLCGLNIVFLALDLTLDKWNGWSWLTFTTAVVTGGMGVWSLLDYRKSFK